MYIIRGWGGPYILRANTVARTHRRGQFSRIVVVSPSFSFLRTRPPATSGAYINSFLRGSFRYDRPRTRTRTRAKKPYNSLDPLSIHTQTHTRNFISFRARARVYVCVFKKVSTKWDRINTRSHTWYTSVEVWKKHVPFVRACFLFIAVVSIIYVCVCIYITTRCACVRDIRRIAPIDVLFSDQSVVFVPYTDPSEFIAGGPLWRRWVRVERTKIKKQPVEKI